MTATLSRIRAFKPCPLYIGNYSSAEKQVILGHNITHVVHCVKYCPNSSYPRYVKTHRVPLVDLPNQNIVVHFSRVFAFLDEAVGPIVRAKQTPETAEEESEENEEEAEEKGETGKGEPPVAAVSDSPEGSGFAVVLEDQEGVSSPNAESVDVAASAGASEASERPVLEESGPPLPIVLEENEEEDVPTESSDSASRSNQREPATASRARRRRGRRRRGGVRGRRQASARSRRLTSSASLPSPSAQRRSSRLSKPSSPSILIHCAVGRSRSVAIACAYLMHRYHKPYDYCYARIRKSRRIAGPNLGFVAQLRAFEEAGYEVGRLRGVWSKLKEPLRQVARGEAGLEAVLSVGSAGRGGRRRRGRGSRRSRGRRTRGGGVAVAAVPDDGDDESVISEDSTTGRSELVTIAGEDEFRRSGRGRVRGRRVRGRSRRRRGTARGE